MVTGLIEKLLRMVLDPILKAMGIPDPSQWIPSFDFGIRDFGGDLSAKVDGVSGGITGTIIKSLNSDSMFDLILSSLTNMPPGCDSTLLRKTQADFNALKDTITNKPKAIWDAVKKSLKDYQPPKVSGCTY